MNITVLGGGRVGSAIVKDLAQDHNIQVTVVDINIAALQKLKSEAPVHTHQVDLGNPEQVRALASAADLVISAVPGFMGFATLKAIIEAGTDVVDISFFPEDAFLLDDLARAQNVTAVVDCGVAPGLCNIIAGYNQSQLDHIESYTCYVGGLPQVRLWPYEYKAVFSPIDVIEEYTRPARFIAHGQEVIQPALSEVELRDFPGVGTLEAFNTDGLRSLCRTVNAPFMQEKTLRYPGHANLMRTFRESGFFDTQAVTLANGQSVKPIDLTAKLLFEQWKMGEDDRDLTVMQVIIQGHKAGQPVTRTYDLLDTYDPLTHTTAMARTTGYTCTIVARQVIQGRFIQKGICPPEFVGCTPGCYENLLEEYAKRNISLKVRS